MLSLQLAFCLLIPVAGFLAVFLPFKIVEIYVVTPLGLEGDEKDRDRPNDRDQV
jgi:hypothetical protein